MPVMKDLQSLKHPDLRGHFSCGTCGQVFAHVASRNKHARKNHHKAEHKCLQCNKAFESRQDLQEHTKNVHKAEFSCIPCELVFFHASSLNRHRRQKHNDHTCLLCNTALGESQDVHEHMTNVHDLTKVLTCACCNYVIYHKTCIAEHRKSVRETGQLGSALPIATSNNAPGAFLMYCYREVPLKNPEGSLSPPNTDSTASSTPSVSSLEHGFPEQSLDELINDAISKILDSGIIYGNTLTLPQTWERIYNIGREMAMEELEKNTE